MMGYIKMKFIEKEDNEEKRGNPVARFFRTRGFGFYVLIPVVILSIVIPFVYEQGFADTDYYSELVKTFCWFVPVAFLLSFCRFTERFAAAGMYVLSMLAFFAFISAGYMHLSTAFFNGINGNPLVQAGFHFSFVTIALLVNMLFSVLGIFIRPSTRIRILRGDEE